MGHLATHWRMTPTNRDRLCRARQRPRRKHCGHRSLRPHGASRVRRAGLSPVRVETGRSKRGFTFEGVFRQHRVVPSGNRDTPWYSLLDHEWPAASKALNAWLDPANFNADGRQAQRLEELRTAVSGAVAANSEAVPPVTWTTGASSRRRPRLDDVQYGHGSCPGHYNRIPP